MLLFKICGVTGKPLGDSVLLQEKGTGKGSIARSVGEAMWIRGDS